MALQTLIKTAEYRDSVALMLLARELGALPGVGAISVVMGTHANKAILRQAGLLSGEAEAAGPNDLIVAVQAQDEGKAREACLQAERMLSRKSASRSETERVRPRSVRSARRLLPQADLAVISVPGEYAAGQAWDALRAGLHVLLFSDHVPLEEEIALKTYAREHDLLLMGPGAGTAIINGFGLGFANAVPRGPVGIVAAAGTGLQEASTLLAKAGVGITQGIGVGGRDVSEAVGGIMMLEGLKALQADHETRVLLVVSKLPSSAVIDMIIARLREGTKAAVLALMSDASDSTVADLPSVDSPSAGRSLLPIYAAHELREGVAIAAALACGGSAAAALARLRDEDRAIRAKAAGLSKRLNPRQHYLRGLYSGGTLCEETMRIWQAAVGRVWSNAPLDPRCKLPDSGKSRGHTAIDLGEEEFTVGRPHPMIDPTLRAQRLLQEARDPAVAAIVLDVVLGFGAHPDPASELAPAIREAKAIASKRKRELIVIASVTGTEQDPQQLSRQSGALQAAGAVVMSSNAAAGRLAGYLVERT